MKTKTYIYGRRTKYYRKETSRTKKRGDFLNLKNYECQIIKIYWKVRKISQEGDQKEKQK